MLRRSGNRLAFAALPPLRDRATASSVESSLRPMLLLRQFAAHLRSMASLRLLNLHPKRLQLSDAGRHFYSTEAPGGRTSLTSQTTRRKFLRERHVCAKAQAPVPVGAPRQHAKALTGREKEV